MKYMLMLIGDEEAWEAQTPEAAKQAYALIDGWWNEQAKAGRIVGGYELKPTRTATTLRRAPGGGIVVTDGPFVETKEAFGGFAIVDVRDLDAAIAVAKGCPLLEVMEIRPIVEHRD